MPPIFKSYTSLFKLVKIKFGETSVWWNFSVC